MKNKKVYALCVKNTFLSQKWKQTILHLGMQVAKQMKIIAKCYVKSAIEESQENNIYKMKKDKLCQ